MIEYGRFLRFPGELFRTNAETPEILNEISELWTAIEKTSVTLTMKLHNCENIDEIYLTFWIRSGAKACFRDFKIGFKRCNSL